MAGVVDRVALVTGAAQGIGAEVAKLLGASGAKVGVLDINLGAARSVADEINFSRRFSAGAGGRRLQA